MRRRHAALGTEALERKHRFGMGKQLEN